MKMCISKENLHLKDHTLGWFACTCNFFKFFILSNSLCTLSGLSWRECWLPSLFLQKKNFWMHFTSMKAQMFLYVLTMTQCILKRGQKYPFIVIYNTGKSFFCTFIFESTSVKFLCKWYQSILDLTIAQVLNNIICTMDSFLCHYLSNTSLNSSSTYHTELPVLFTIVWRSKDKCL